MPLPMYSESEKKPLAEIRYILGIAAGKGGVGKSTLTAHLALALTRLGQKVGVLDADLYGPSLRKMLPEAQKPSVEGEIIHPAISQGIKVVTMSYFRAENDAVVVRAPIANGIINQFLTCVSWGQLDFLLIDFPPGTGDIQLTLAQKSHLTGAIIVTTPQEIALLDVRKAINMFQQVRIPILGIVENMSYYLSPYSDEKEYIFGKGGGERLSNEFGAPFFGEIPLDPAVCKNGDLGTSHLLYDQKEKSFSAEAILRVASQVIDQSVALNGVSKSSFELIWKEES